jgi:putative spermidine/putrescine transport system substrate-binding protein
MVVSRRAVLKGGTVLVAMPAVISLAAAQDRRVVVRTTGGAVGDAMVKGVYTPFEKETGIRVVAVPMSAGKVWAMHKSGNMELDVVDAAMAQLYDMAVEGALAPIAYNKFKYTDINDIDPADRTKTSIGNWYFTTALTYNTKAFRDRHPSNWAEFWDTKTFPGKRLLQDIGSNELPLEFALIADGVAPDKLYPLDVDRAFKSMDRLKPDIIAYFSTAASAVQILNNEEAMAAALWNAQGQAVHDAGGPVSVDQNQGMLASEGLAVTAAAKNPENAQLLIDYALQPKSQAALLHNLTYGPTNRKALDLLPKAVLPKLPNGPQNLPHVFRRSNAWWHENFKAMSERWTKWRSA